MRPTLLLGVLLAAFAALALSPAARAAEDADAEQRRAAREAVLIEWSKDAKTETLGLSDPATDFLDLWLDFCRSKHAKRTKESVQFQGTPHAEWGEDEGPIHFKAAFVNIELAWATLSEEDAPGLLDAILSDGFAAAVRVTGDEDRWLRLWGVMLATQVAERRVETWRSEAFRESCARVRDSLLATLPETGAFGDGTVRVGSLASERLVWLLGIRAVSGDRAGALLKEVCSKLRAGGAEKCARATAAILAGCCGEEAETFVIAELASGDWERQRTVLAGTGRYATPALIAEVARLAKALETDEQAQMAFLVLHRAASKDAAHPKAAAATLARVMGELPDDSDRKTMAAMALVQSENATPEVVAWFETLVVRLEKEGAHAGRIEFLRRVIERAAAQPGAKQAEEPVEEPAEEPNEEPVEESAAG